METSTGNSIRVFDGTTDFRVWRARVENELMRYHLLGYVMVRGYDGSQTFTYNGEVVPPRMPAILEEDGQQQQSSLKEEARTCHSGGNPQGRLGRWAVLGESAEAKGILQRYLHPDVESVILNKNVYDSWTMLCTLYGNRDSPGAHDVYEMHRVLHNVRLGDKKGEPVKEFLTRWEMVLQQYARAIGIELTEAFRSVSLTQTLPSAWKPMVASWRGTRPFVPFTELVKKVTLTREQAKVPLETASGPSSVVVEAHSPLLDSPTSIQPNSRPGNRSPIETFALESSVGATIEPLGHRNGDAATEAVEKKSSKEIEVVEQRASETSRNKDRSTRSVDRGSSSCEQYAEKSTSISADKGENKSKHVSTFRSRERSRRSPSERVRNRSASRSRTWEDKTDKRHTHDKYDKYDYEKGYDEYASKSRYQRFERVTHNYDNYDRSDKSGIVMCFYCLKAGHQMKQCWYLKADIESETTHDVHKKFCCAVTVDRTPFMVRCLEGYIEGVNRERANRRPSSSTTSTSRNHGDYSVSKSVGRDYRPKSDGYVISLPRESTFGLRDQPTSSATSTATDYRKRSRSVFQPAEGRVLSRDPRLNRSNSVFGSTGVLEEFSPRKRVRSPSFERQLQIHY